MISETLEKQEFRIVAPTGCLGYGFSTEDFRRVMSDFKPDLVGVDAGSTDPGPYYLGAGESFTSYDSVKYELTVIIEECIKHGVPLVVGNCGGAGGSPHLALVRTIVDDIGRSMGKTLKVALLDSEVHDRELLTNLISQKRELEFESDLSLSRKEALEATRIVSQMGIEPVMKAFEQRPDIVLAGRICDDAIFAALPIAQGFSPAVCNYAGKVLECGALACEPVEMDVLTATITQEGVVFEPGAHHRRSTVKSVTGHSLYERENPFIHSGPEGDVDLTDVNITQIDKRSVMVSGLKFNPREMRTLKFEGVRHMGYRVISIAGCTDPIMISQIDSITDEVRRRTVQRLEDAGVRFQSLETIIYGLDGSSLMKNERSSTQLPEEIGILIEAIGETIQDAKTACHEFSGSLLHVDYPGQLNTAGNLAFPFSPSEIVAGDVYEFSVYHLFEVDDVMNFVSIEIVELGEMSK